jgi:hypothetical protein
MIRISLLPEFSQWYAEMYVHDGYFATQSVELCAWIGLHGVNMNRERF